MKIEKLKFKRKKLKERYKIEKQVADASKFSIFTSFSPRFNFQVALLHFIQRDHKKNDCWFCPFPLKSYPDL